MIKKPIAKSPELGGARLMIELAVRSDMERFLHTAVRLAKILDIDLRVVSRQDPSVLRAAALPVVQEVCLWTAREQQISTGTLSRSIRILSRQARARLERMAEREAVACSFVSGPESESHLEEAGSTERQIRWVGGRGISARSDTHPVCVLDSGDAAGQACLQQAARLANRAHRPLKIYSMKGKDEKGDVESADRFLQQAQGLTCFVLFMPESAYLKCNDRNLLNNAPFPVLLV